jgi:hypothetical protein
VLVLASLELASVKPSMMERGLEIADGAAAKGRRDSAAELVSGSISLPSAEENTLDEPVSATIVRAVVAKIWRQLFVMWW